MRSRTCHRARPPHGGNISSGEGRVGGCTYECERDYRPAISRDHQMVSQVEIVGTPDGTQRRARTGTLRTTGPAATSVSVLPGPPLPREAWEVGDQRVIRGRSDDEQRRSDGGQMVLRRVSDGDLTCQGRKRRGSLPRLPLRVRRRRRTCEGQRAVVKGGASAAVNGAIGGHQMPPISGPIVVPEHRGRAGRRPTRG